MSETYDVDRRFSLEEVKLCIHQALDERESRIMDRVGDIRADIDSLERRILIWETRAQSSQYAAKIFWGILLGLFSITIELLNLGKITIH